MNTYPYSSFPFHANLTNIASGSRVTWDWARGGGLPLYFAYMRPKHRVPHRSLVLAMLASISALCLLNIGSGGYAAFGVIIPPFSLALYLAYAIAIASVLCSLLRTSPGLTMGEWSLGRYGSPVNVVALVYAPNAMV
ncbi:hypothetical protein DL765_006460 [Monosporascus sp. GIB2]|nr:hypothetical protein DL765_006460 [Monosporascus sp. GIB2]